MVDGDTCDRFLRHNGKDQAAAAALAAALAGRGILAWLDFQQLPPGTREPPSSATAPRYAWRS